MAGSGACLQLVAGDLGLALVFVWGGAPRGGGVIAGFHILCRRNGH